MWQPDAADDGYERSRKVRTTQNGGPPSGGQNYKSGYNGYLPQKSTMPDKFGTKMDMWLEWKDDLVDYIDVGWRGHSVADAVSCQFQSHAGSIVHFGLCSDTTTSPPLSVLLLFFLFCIPTFPLAPFNGNSILI